MSKLNIVSIIRDEAVYLPEWLEWHLLQGADHFYIYDNTSEDHTKKILRNYASIGLVTWSPWPRHPDPNVSSQLMMYRHFIKSHPTSLDWCAFIDADEFLYFNERDTAKEWLELYPPLLDIPEDAAAIEVPWILYGSNGHIDYEPGFVIERFTRRASRLDKHIKTILRPKYVLREGNDAHAFRVKEGYQFYNVFGEVVPPLTPTFSERDLSSDILRINHYHTKSREEFRVRCARGRIDINRKRNFEESFPVHDRNDVEDIGPLQWIDKLRESLSSRPWNKEKEKICSTG